MLPLVYERLPTRHSSFSWSRSDAGEAIVAGSKTIANRLRGRHRVLVNDVGADREHQFAMRG